MLMGNSLGDLLVSDGIANPNPIHKIGFLNKSSEENLIKYKVSADGSYPSVILKIGFLKKNTQEKLIKYKVGADG
jgi:hypothetical protein